MSWICNNCETENNDTLNQCEVCDAIAPSIKDFAFVFSYSSSSIYLEWNAENCDNVILVYANKGYNVTGLTKYKFDFNDMESNVTFIIKNNTTERNIQVKIQLSPYQKMMLQCNKMTQEIKPKVKRWYAATTFITSKIILSVFSLGVPYLLYWGARQFPEQIEFWGTSLRHFAPVTSIFIITSLMYIILLWEQNDWKDLWKKSWKMFVTFADIAIPFLTFIIISMHIGKTLPFDDIVVAFALSMVGVLSVISIVHIFITWITNSLNFGVLTLKCLSCIIAFFIPIACAYCALYVYFPTINAQLIWMPFGLCSFNSILYSAYLFDRDRDEIIMSTKAFFLIAVIAVVTSIVISCFV